MKKIMIICSLLCLFLLASCNEPNNNTNTDSKPETTETNSDETSTSNTNEEQKDDSKEESNDSKTESSLPDYDDGHDWHGTVD